MYTVIKKGLHYVLHAFKGEATFELVFTHRDTNRKPVAGVTRETVYNVLINMIEVADEKNPKHENKIQLRHLRAALESQRRAISNKIENEKSDIR